MLMLYFQDFVNVLKLFIRKFIDQGIQFFFFFNWQVIFELKKAQRFLLITCCIIKQITLSILKQLHHEDI